MNTYTWQIDALDCVPQEDGKTDVVMTAHWRVNATDGEYLASVYGTQSLTYDAKSPFTPYENLTLVQVVAWTQDAMGTEQVAALQENLDKQIENQINPSVVTPQLPWAAK